MFASLLQEVASAVSLSQSSESLLQVLGEVESSGILLSRRESSSHTVVGESGAGESPDSCAPCLCRVLCPLCILTQRMQSGDREWLCQQSAWEPGLPHSRLNIRPSPCR